MPSRILFKTLNMKTPEEILEKYKENIMTDNGYKGQESLVRPENAIKAMIEYVDQNKNK